jgi:hypothetical protein
MRNERLERVMGLAVASAVVSLATVATLREIHGEKFAQAFRDNADDIIDLLRPAKMPGGAEESFGATIQAVSMILQNELASVPSQRDDWD